MKKESLFSQLTKSKFKTLDQYVPVVERVHGDHHPEFIQVRKYYDQIVDKIKAAGVETPQLIEEWEGLREITQNYTVPGDVCETYEAVYHMLAEIDKAYSTSVNQI